MVKRALSLGVLFVLAVSATATSAGARPGAAESTEHQVVTAGNRYVPGDAQQVEQPAQVIFVGDSLTHTNLDAAEHDLQAIGSNPEGNPWFDSPLIGLGESASVAVESVPAGIYAYTCSIHPFMRGRLEIRDVTPKPEADQGEIEVSSGDSFFAPKDLTVVQGTTVRWKNNGQISHTVTAKDGSFDSSPGCPSGAPCWAPGATFSHTFNAAGVFPYYCKLHGNPQGGGHAGVVQVVPPGGQPTTIDTLTASAAGTAISVSGTATFRGETPVALAQDPATDGPPGAAETGLELTGAKVYRPDPAMPFLFFEWHVAGLPSTGSLPEALRYTIPFKAGTQVYRVQAKLTDVASPEVTEHADDPLDGREFALKRCLVGAGDLVQCFHLEELTGTFDPVSRLVRAKVPVSALAPGTPLARNTSGPAELTRIQAAYATPAGTLTADEAEWGADASFAYRVAGSEVTLGIAPPGTPASAVVFDTPATVDGSSYGGSIAVPGTGEWDVWVKACFGTNCATTLRRVSV